MRRGQQSRFAALFEGLPRQKRVSFVADLYAARGWKVARDGEELVATRDGCRRRLAVVEPGRVRAPDLPDVDVVVAVRDDDSLRSAAAEAEVEYLAPDDLRDRLRYGLDSERAAGLAERYFDRPASELDEPADREWPGAGLRRRLSERDTQRASLVAILLLVAAVWTVSTGAVPGLDASEPRPTVTATYTPGAVGAIGGGRTYPAGLGPEGVNNSGRLAIAHSRFLGGRPRAYRISASGPQHAPFMMGLTAWNATVRVENATHYRYRKRMVAPYGFRVEQRADNETHWEPRWPPLADNGTGAESLSKQVYADGTEKFWRYAGPDQVRYRRASVAQQGDRIFGIVDLVGQVGLYVETFLWTTNSSVRCRTRSRTDDCETFRVVATGDPVELSQELVDYRAVAVVDDAGFVRSLTVRYKIARLGNESELASVRFRLEYVAVGEERVSVSQPPWLETARERTRATPANRTETPTTAGS